MALKTLQGVNWKRHANTAYKVLRDIKVLSMLGLLGFIIYGIGWDTVLAPNLATLKTRDEAIQKQREDYSQRNMLKEQYGSWESQLRDLDVTLTPVPPDGQIKVVSLGVSTDLVALARGQARPENLPALPPPHDKRFGVAISQSGSEVLDLLALSGLPMVTVESNPADPLLGLTGGGSTGPSTLMVERYDYDLKASGTFTALVDLLNQLTLRKQLIRLNKVEIARPATAPSAGGPSSGGAVDVSTGDDPRLDMTISLSVFFYTDPTMKRMAESAQESGEEFAGPVDLELESDEPVVIESE